MLSGSGHRLFYSDWDIWWISSDFRSLRKLGKRFWKRVPVRINAI
jgi:hypothetical protein